MITKQTKAPKRLWGVTSSPNMTALVGETVLANTKGEARAALKEHLGVEELPAAIVPGCTISRFI